jgi:hypothetical protein
LGLTCPDIPWGADWESGGIGTLRVDLRAGVAVERCSCLSGFFVRCSYPLRVVLGVKIEEEMVPSPYSSPNTFSSNTFSPNTFSPNTFSPNTFSPNTFRDSVATEALVTSASDSFSFPEKDSLYTLY